ncbi:MAG: LPS-assembly protein LptD [Bryobacterales bacterium]|nr:LPS-assembly protein LptD [Bryobacterales bacterium]
MSRLFILVLAAMSASLGFAADCPEAAPATDPVEGVLISACKQLSEGDMRRARGSVDVRTGAIVITADEADFNDETGELEVRGNVHYRTLSGDEDLYASKVAYNTRSELGTFYDAHGTVSSASQAGARILTTDNPFYIDGPVVHKAGEEYVVMHGTVTNCDPEHPWWTMRSPKTRIEPGKSATIHQGVLRIKGAPLLYVPVFKKSLERVPRKSGFLTPSVGTSSRFGMVLAESYYWAINRSYDATINGTYYTARGPASQLSFRGRPTKGSYFDAVFFGVADRGRKLDDGSRYKQGGSQFAMRGATMLPGGFRGVADIRYLSSLEFKQTFTQTYQEAASSQVRSIGFATKNFSTYSINAALLRDENFQSTERNNTIVIRKLPSVEFNSRERLLLKGPAPVYFALDSAFDLAGRTQRAFQTRRYVQRGDLYPRFTVPLRLGLVNVTPTFGGRITGYGQSRVARTGPGEVAGDIVGENLYRASGEFSVDIAPPALQRIYNGPKWLGDKVKHVIEPRLRYRYTTGIHDFDRIVRFDARDILNNTNEADVSITQRLYAKDAATGQTREVLSLEVWQRRYFDPDLGGAIVPGMRNVVRSSIDLTPFAFFDRARHYSPVVMALRTRPSWKSGLEWRTDYDPLRDKIVNSSVTFDYQVTSLIKTAIGHNAVRVPNELSPASNQLTTLIGFGDFNRRGWNFAVNSIYDYRRQNFLYTRGQLSYNTDCCGFGIEFGRIGYSTLPQNQFRVSLSIANVGSFGTLRPQERLF